MATSVGAVQFDIEINRASIQAALKTINIEFAKGGVSINNLSFTPQAVQNVKDQIQKAISKTIPKVAFDIEVNKPSIQAALKAINIEFAKGGVAINNLSLTPQALQNIKDQIKKAVSSVSTELPTPKISAPSQAPRIQAPPATNPRVPAPAAPPAHQGNSKKNSEDILLVLRSQLTTAQALASTNKVEAEQLAKQAASIREALRFKQQLASIRNAGLSPEDLKRSEQFARDLTKLNQQRIKIPVEIDTAGVQRGSSVIQGIFQGVGQQITSILTNALQSGVGAGFGAIKGSLSDVAQFEGALNTFQVRTQGSAEELAKFRAEAIRVGIETSKTPQDVANLGISLASLGSDAEDAAKNVEPVIKASEATGIAVDELAESLKVGENIFKEQGETVATLADKYAILANNTAAAGATDFKQIFSKAGVAAKDSGADVNELLALFGTLRDTGSSAEIAGTAVAGIFTKFRGNTDEAKEALQQLEDLAGAPIKLFDEFGSLRTDIPLVDTLKNLRDVTATLSDEAAGDILGKIFGAGRGGGTAILSVLDQLDARFESTLSKLQASDGSAIQSASDGLLKGFSGALKFIQGTLNAISIEFGTAFTGLLDPLIRESANLFGNFLKTDPFAPIRESVGNLLVTLQNIPGLGNTIGQAFETIANGAIQTIASTIDNISASLAANPAIIQNVTDGFVAFTSNVGALVPVFNNLVSQAASFGAISFASITDTFVSLSPLIDTISGGFKFLADNAGLVDLALKAMIGRFIVIQGLSLGTSIITLGKSFATLPATIGAAQKGIVAATTALKGLNAVTVVSSIAGLKAAFVSASAGASAFAASLGGLAVAAAPVVAGIAAIGAALAVAGIIKAANDLRVLNQEVEAFRAGTQALSGGGISLADGINNNLRSGLDTDAEKNKFQEQIKLADAQIAEFENKRAELNNKLTSLESGANPFANLFGGKDAAKRALEVQIAELDVTQKALENRIKAGQEILSGKTLNASDNIAGALQAGQKVEDASVKQTIQTEEEKEKIRKEKLDNFQRDTEKALNAIEQSELKQIENIRRQQLAGAISQEEAEAQIGALEGNTQARIKAKQDEIAKINQLEKNKTLTAIEAAQQREAAELEVSNLVIQGIEAQIEAQERAKEAAIKRLDTELNLAQQAADVRQTELDIAGEALGQQQSLLSAQQALAASTAQLQESQLNRTLEIAKAEGDVTTARQAAGAIAATQQQALQTEFAIKQKALGITIEQNKLESQRAIVAAEVAAVEARIAVQKAKAEGISNEEIRGLKEILALRLEQVGAARDGAANQESINGILQQQLDIDKQLAEEKLKQVDSVGALAKAEENLASKQRDYFNEQISQAQRVAEVRASAISAVFGAISQQANKSAEEGLSALSAAQDRLDVARNAGFFRSEDGSAGARETEQAITQVQRLLSSGASDQQLANAAFRNRDNTAFAEALNLAGRGDIASLIDAEQGFGDIAIAIFDAQTAITAKLDELRLALIERDISAATQLPQSPLSNAIVPANQLGALNRAASIQPGGKAGLNGQSGNVINLENMMISTPDPVANTAQILSDFSRQQTRGRR